MPHAGKHMGTRVATGAMRGELASDLEDDLPKPKALYRQRLDAGWEWQRCRCRG
jgi:hypothetical protein